MASTADSATARNLSSLLFKANSAFFLSVISRTEFRTLRSDGTYIPVEAIGQNLMDVPGVNGIVITTHPLTRQKLAEKALRESERLLADIIDFLPDATFAIDQKGKIIVWNQAKENYNEIIYKIQ